LSLCGPWAESGDELSAIYSMIRRQLSFHANKKPTTSPFNQDFRILNISIPPNQIIDTAEIYHQPNQRYISLRYLTNYVVGCEWQQDVHDSVEDAKAAYDLYNKALSLKSQGKLDEFLVTLYADGHKSQFKLVD
jgi:hypothetical protein